MEDSIKNITLQESKEFTLPKGGTIVSKECTITARKIKNGFLIEKNYNIKYKLQDSEHLDYEYYTEIWYTKDNPVTYKEPKEVNLADKL